MTRGGVDALADGRSIAEATDLSGCAIALRPCRNRHGRRQTGRCGKVLSPPESDVVCMTRRLVMLAAALLGYSALDVAQTKTAPPPTPPSEQQDKPPPFRLSVNVVAVDVQVIGRDGRPVPDLGPEKFSVTINGKRRR